MVTADNRILDKPSDPIHAKWNDARVWDECLRIGQLMASEAAAHRQGCPDASGSGPGLLFAAVNSRSIRLMWDDHPGLAAEISAQRRQVGHDAMNLVNLGDAQILTIPGEALPNIGFYLKRQMKGKNNLLFGLTNDAFGYILTKVDFNSFKRYEYVSHTSLGEMTGEVLIENAVKLIDDSPAPAQASK